MAAKLFPKPVFPFAPVRQDERQHYLGLLFTQYEFALKEKKLQPNDDGDSISNDVITRAVEKEHEICKMSHSRMQYMSTIKRIMYNIKKYGNEQGTVTRQKNKIRKAKLSGQRIDLDIDELYKRLPKLCIPKQTLVDHGYVMEVPVTLPDAEIPDMVECQHCHDMFSRKDEYSKELDIDQSGVVKGPATCRFHPGKKQIVTDSDLLGGRFVRNRNYTSRFYGCCHEVIGQSEGCREDPCHVFKFNDPRYLHHTRPFQTIESLRKKLDIRDDEKSQIMRKKMIKAIGIDCEMCFSSNGFELTKVSAIDFKTMRPILNNLVVPEGKMIIDLNSDVSGVNSVPSTKDKGTLTFDEVMVKLAQLTDKDTIVIGHGLENDLNVLRLIYPRIVDTAILFSENQIDPMRKDPLKKLSWKYLSKNVQLDEHDPLEDAELPVKIVKRVLGFKKYA